VFQCNRRDLEDAMDLRDMQDALAWPSCAYMPSITRSGEGVVNALRRLLGMLGHVGMTTPYR
jgi:hypothetical protein